jgi:hypothetical protein
MVFDSLKTLLTGWCPGGDSNPHEVKPRRILSPQRLPFRHPGTGTANLAYTKSYCNTAIGISGRSNTPVSVVVSVETSVAGSNRSTADIVCWGAR